MEKDLSQIEGFLRRNERDIEAIDDEIKGLEGTIAGMQSEIVNLTQQKEICLDLSVSLKVRLGMLPPRQKAAMATNSSNEDKPDFVVPKNFVKDMGPADGALKILRRKGKPMGHPELVQALLKGNVRSESQNTDAAFRTAMGRRKEFVWVKEDGARGFWALREWPGYENYERGAKLQTSEPTDSRPKEPTDSRPNLALVSGTEGSSAARI